MFQTNEMVIIGFLGQSGVGKSHIIHRYLTNSLPQKLSSTIAVEFATGFYKMEDGNKLKLKIWDTSGQQKYKQIVCFHLKQAQAIIFVYDITDEKSFKKIDDWLVKVQKQEIQNNLFVLIGNKSDLNQVRNIEKNEGEQKAKQIGAYFYELNSQNYQQVTDTMNQIIETLIQRKADRQIDRKRKQQLRQTKSKKQLLPIGIQGSSTAEAVCSKCQTY